MATRGWLSCAVVVVVLLAPGARAASPQQNAGRVQQVPSFRSGITAVPIDVRVIDKDGRPITDLKLGDFTILEDGVPQTIAHFVPQVLTPEAPRPGSRARPDTQPFDPSPQSHRVFLIVLGSGALGDPQKHPETLNAVVHFVRDCLLPQDQVALLAYGRATDFTSDHEKIARLLETFRGSEAIAKAALTRQSGLAAADAASVFARPETLDRSPAVETELGFEEYVSASGGRPLGDLDALFYGIKYLRFMAGEKHLIFVTDIGPEPTWDQVQYLTRSASSARVALDTVQLGYRMIDHMGAGVAGEFPAPPREGWRWPDAAEAAAAAGLTPAAAKAIAAGREPEAPTRSGSDTTRAGGGTPGGTLVGLPRLYDLRYAASQTGGQPSMLRDAAPSLAGIDIASRAHYLLAYYPANADWNGRYRSVKVQVNRPGATVLFRHGYYASRGVDTFDRRRVVADNRIASAGYQLSDIREIDVQITPAFTKSATGRGGELSVAISIDTSRLSWSLDADQLHVAHLDVAIYCVDRGGEKSVGETKRRLNLRLTDETYQRVARERFSHTMRVPVTAKPRYVKVIVYDYDADRVGSVMRMMK